MLVIKIALCKGGMGRNSGESSVQPLNLLLEENIFSVNLQIFWWDENISVSHFPSQGFHWQHSQSSSSSLDLSHFQELDLFLTPLEDLLWSLSKVLWWIFFTWLQDIENRITSQYSWVWLFCVIFFWIVHTRT